MDSVIAVFRSRSETLGYSNLLRSYGVDVKVINTPREVNVSCGISVKFDIAYIKEARDILTRRRFDTFAGFYLVKKMGNKFFVKPI